jgi:hypothetical protein
VTADLPNALIFQNSDHQSLGDTDTELAVLWANALAFRLAAHRHAPTEAAALILQVKEQTGPAWQFLCQTALYIMATQVVGNIAGKFDTAFFVELDREIEQGAILSEAALAEYVAAKNGPDDLDS